MRFGPPLKCSAECDVLEIVDVDHDVRVERIDIVYFDKPCRHVPCVPACLLIGGNRVPRPASGWRVWQRCLLPTASHYAHGATAWHVRAFGSPSGSEASMLSLVGSDRRLTNKCPSERKCHHARLPLECASESRQSTRPARYETKTRDISA